MGFRGFLALAACLAAAALLAPPAWSHPPDDDHTHTKQQGAGTEQGSLGEIGAKLSDPTANIWALSFNITAPSFSDGDLNSGNAKLGGNMVFQPVLPIPLYGSGEDQWKILTRPVIPFIFAQQIPNGGVDNFKHVGGIGDIDIPLLLNPTARMLGNWIFAAGPIFEFPTSTHDALGAQQYSIGPAVALGYKTKAFTAVLFPNYFFGVGDRSDRKSSTRTTSKLNLLYGLTFNLPQAWQVGFNPTISYNHKATSGNKWTVPVGLFVSKVIQLGKLPVKIQGGLEYSVVSPDAFGQRAGFRFVVTPVIPGLIKNPIFGGG